MVTDFINKVINLGFGALLITKENIEEVIDEMVKNGGDQKRRGKGTR